MGDASTSVALLALSLLELGVEETALLLAALASPLMQLSTLFMACDCAVDLSSCCNDHC